MKHYKIRRRSDGLFSTGGKSPRFVKDNGKVFKKRSNVSSHITNLIKHPRKRYIQEKPEEPRVYGRRTIPGHFEEYCPSEVYEDCEIVEYELVVSSTEDLSVVIAEKKESLEKKKAERKQRIAAQNEEKEYQKYMELKNRFEPSKDV